MGGGWPGTKPSSVPPGGIPPPFDPRVIIDVLVNLTGVEPGDIILVYDVDGPTVTVNVTIVVDGETELGFVPGHPPPIAVPGVTIKTLKPPTVSVRPVVAPSPPPPSPPPPPPSPSPPPPSPSPPPPP